jgi:hypothetical protein
MLSLVTSPIMLSVVMLNVVILNVVMLNVVAPAKVLSCKSLQEVFFEFFETRQESAHLA